MRTMKFTTYLSALAASAILCGLAACSTAKEEEREEAALQSQAKITKADAEKIALTKAPGGTVKEAELEKEKGVIVWSFDIMTPGTEDITEVLVDAKTGKVVSVETESPEAENREAKGEEEHEDKD